MTSVENFYWILYDNLLKPVRLDCWYYYPWGTKQNLSRGEFKTCESSRDFNHVFFHFDQEPLWSDRLGSYDFEKAANSNKLVRILANSERSALKTDICRSRGFVDWYFFYHGFAALDWYRDAEFVQQNHPFSKAFLSLNHAFDHRAYRVALLARLLDQEIAHNGSISFHANLQNVREELANTSTRLSESSKLLVQKHMSSLNSLPWKIDDVPINGDLSARFGFNELKLWQSSLWHVVNETVFYEDKLHLTEKVFKPIVAKRPFILVAAPGNLAYLRTYGFQTFDHWIDESYDDIHDPDLRLDAIAREIARLAFMPMDQLRRMHREMECVLDYNKQHFFGKFREIIVSELVDNFDQCIRIWNNGRVDGREMCLHPDLNRAKQILLS